MTATDEGCISRRIEVRISSRVYVRRGFGTESARITRMSAATAPSGVAITGLRSTSAISGKSATSWDTRRICSAIAHRSTPARPRTPRRISAALIESSMDSASSALTGASRNVTSLRTSTSTPPSPNATTFPNVGSVTAPTMTSCPCGSNSWTCTPSMRADAAYARAFSMILWNAARTSAAPSTPTITPPASVLCRMSGETIFITTGPPNRAAYDTASSTSVANSSPGTAIPYASAITLPSGAVSAVRPSARTASRSDCTLSSRSSAITSDHSVRLEQAQFLVAEAEFADVDLCVVLAEQG